MIVKYVNSNNSSIDFFASDIKISNGSFHQRKWEIKDDEITKNPTSYKLTITLRGTLESRKKKLNELCEIFEVDLLNNKKGKLFYGDYFYSCFILSSNTTVNPTFNNRTDIEIEAYGIQYWIREKSYSLNTRMIKYDDTNEKKYTYKYPFVYNSQKGIYTIINDNYNPSDIIIRMFGLAVNPFIKIGDTVYQINASIDKNEYFEINTEKRTIFKVSNFGTRTNAFMFRSKSRSDFFLKIPSGSLKVAWNNTFNVEIVIIEKRSEPRWG